MSKSRASPTCPSCSTPLPGLTDGRYSVMRLPLDVEKRVACGGCGVALVVRYRVHESGRLGKVKVCRQFVDPGGYTGGKEVGDER